MTEHEIFVAAIKLSGEERDRFLDESCRDDSELRREIASLLQAHEGTELGLLQQVVRDLHPSAAVDLHGPGTIIAGRYHLKEPIGQGGMGSVWLAEQKEPVKRKVALKLVKAGMDSQQVLARFEAERQALAMMDHQHIAKVFDGGVTDQGRPYFVMELVKGAPITEYCDQAQLTIRERLELFNQICAAVQHAHQKGIIHRDLKPSNIMVTEYDGRPVCKVIDFGLAKALHGGQLLTDQSLNTAFGTVLGTPLYMAPEQLSSSAFDVDTRSDLYSLGVVLYELLTGSTPIESHRLRQAAWDEICRIIRDEEPARPSTRLSSSDALPSLAARRHVEPGKLTHLVRGELDWIILKALEKDRNRRYESASSLALDIQRYLSGEAVRAAPSSRIYRLRKFTRRHRGSVMVASLLLLSLIAGIIGTSFGLIRANQFAKLESAARIDAQNKQVEAETQRSRAEEREQQAIEAVKKFGSTVANNNELKNNPAFDHLRATLLQEPIAFFRSLRERLQSSVDTRPESLSRLASAAFDLGKLSHEIGNKQDAIQAYQESLDVYVKLAEANPANTDFQSGLASCYGNLGTLLSETGKPSEAMAAYEKSLEIRESLAQTNPAVTAFEGDVALCHNNIATLLRTTGKPDEAMAAHERALKIRERLVQENPNHTEFQEDLASSHNNIGNLLRATGQPDEAMVAYEKALAILERLVQKNPTSTDFLYSLAMSYNSVGALFTITGKPTKALAAHQKALEIQERLVQKNPTNTNLQNSLALSYNNLAGLLRETGKSNEALAAFEKTLELRKRLARENPTDTEFQNWLGAGYFNLGNMLREADRLSEALTAYETAIGHLERQAQENPTLTEFQNDLALSYSNMGNVLRASGQPDEAMIAFEKALKIQARLLQENRTVMEFQRNLASSQTNLGILLHEMGQPAEAKAAYEKALKIQEHLVQKNPTVPLLQSRVGGTLNNIATIEIEAGQFESARDRLWNAIQWQRRALATNPADPTYRRSLESHLTNLVETANGLGDWALLAEAERGWAELEISEPSQAKIETRIRAILAGEKETDSAELLSLGERAHETMRFILAVELWGMALERYPNLRDGTGDSLSVAAACAAVLAADGQGIDDPAPDQVAKVRLRGQALRWLLTEVKSCQALLQSSDKKQKEAAKATLKKLKNQPALASVQEDAITKLPEDEQQEWRELWKQAAEINFQ